MPWADLQIPFVSNNNIHYRVRFTKKPLLSATMAKICMFAIRAISCAQEIGRRTCSFGGRARARIRQTIYITRGALFTLSVTMPSYL